MLEGNTGRANQSPPNHKGGTIWPDENRTGPDTIADAEHVNEKRAQASVLVVDDDPDIREILRKTLTAAGYSVRLAEDGDLAIEEILSSPPDLVILDEMMPRLSGREVLEELYRRGLTEVTTVVILTARPERSVDKKEYLAKGAAAVLFKPFGHREIRIMVDNLLELRRLRRRMAELERHTKRAERRYRALIESANDLIFTLDSAGNFVYLNAAFEKITDFVRDEWLGRPLAELATGPERRDCAEAVQKALAGRAVVLEMRAGRRDGRVVHLSLSLAPLREDARVVGVVGVARDITERRRLEDRIRELSDFTNTILRSLGSGLITLDASRRITYANETARKITGVEYEEIVGLSIDEVFPGLGEQLAPAALLKEGGELTSREAVFTRKDGKRIYLGYSITCRPPKEDQRVAAVLTFRDITELKEMQAQILRMDRLASLGVLASGIAHEIRNPLASIKMMAQTLQDEIEEGDPRREYLDRIIRQVNRLDELIRVFFAYARPPQPVKRPHPLPGIIAEVRALLDKRLRSKGILFREEYADGLPKVYVDSHQMQQVFMNLFLNALDAMPEGGELIVRAEAVHTTLHAVERRRRTRFRPVRGLFVKVEVEDTGRGIPQDILGNIFDPFFTTKPQGMGLGLSIVHRIVVEHDGEISVTSEEGKGTRFTLLVPTEEVEE